MKTLALSGVGIALWLGSWGFARADGEMERTVFETKGFLADVRQGSFAVAMSWEGIKTIFSYDEVLHGVITFTPSVKAPQCESVSMIQSVKMEDNYGKDFDWPDDQMPRNQLKTIADPLGHVEAGVFIDHDASRCHFGSPCSPFYRDHWPNEDEGSRDGWRQGNFSGPAVLIDYPFGWQIIAKAKFETCALCRDDMRILGCVQWGGAWPLQGDRGFIVGEGSEAPSPTFASSLAIFQNRYPAR